MTARRPHNWRAPARAWPTGHALAALWAAFALLQPPVAQGGAAAAAGGLEVRLGFDGAVKLGTVVPLEVAVPALDVGGPAEVAVDAPALGPGAGRVVATTVVPYRAVAGAAQIIRVPVVVNDPRRPLLVRASVSGREVLRASVGVSPEQALGRLVVVLSEERTGLASLSRLPDRVGVAYVTGRSLPRRWQEYAAVDLLVIRDLDQGAVDPVQQEAALTWVQLGGQLLIIGRPMTRVPAWLEPILPASTGPVRVTTVPSGAGPPGPLAVVTLRPHPDAQRVVAGDLTLMATAAAGRGRVTLSGLDPWQPQFLEWAGGLRWWNGVIGKGAASTVDPAAVAETLPAGTPLPSLAHAEAGAAIFLYIGLILAIRRRWNTVAGAAWSALIALLGAGAFSVVATQTRSHSAMVTEAMILEAASGARLAHAVAIGAVAVPYGGRYHLLIERDMVARPVTPSGSLHIELSRSGTIIDGSLRPGEPARPFVADGLVPLTVSAALSPDGRRLLVDLGGRPARRVEIRRGDRVYPVGDLPAGRSRTDIRPDEWVAAADADRASGEFSQRLRAAIFQAPQADAILGGARVGATPVLLGELGGVPAAFALGGAAAPGQRVTILVVPLERR